MFSDILLKTDPQIIAQLSNKGRNKFDLFTKPFDADSRQITLSQFSDICKSKIPYDFLQYFNIVEWQVYMN